MPEKLIRMSFDVPDDLRDRLRLCAATNQMAQRKIVIKALEEFLARQLQTNPFSFLKKAIDIVTYLNEEIEPLRGFLKKRSDGYWSGICQLSDCPRNTVTSFVVSQEKQIFYCFECCNGGDLLQFLSARNHMSIKEVLKELYVYVLKRDGLPLTEAHKNVLEAFPE